jgi:hypothetical protein
MARDRWTGIALLLLGTGLAANALSGPLVLGIMKLHESLAFNNQFVGGEIVSLFVAAPLALVAGVLWLKGHELAPLLAFAPAIYTLYTILTLILGGNYAHQPGNSEEFFPLHWLLLVLSWVIIVRSWSAINPSGIAPPSDPLRRLTAGTLLLVSLAVGFVWLRQVVAVLAGEPVPDYPEGATLFWLIRLFDLVFFVPLAFATGVRLFRHDVGAVRVAYALSGFLAGELGAVAAMMAVMLATGDPSASAPVLAGLIVVCGWITFVTAALFRSYLRNICSPRTLSRPSFGAGPRVVPTRTAKGRL